MTTEHTDFTTMPPEASDLVIRLMQASRAQADATTNTLLDSLTEQLADSRAEVDAIRARIQGLFYGPYEPSENAILNALYPSDELRAHFRRDRDAS